MKKIFIVLLIAVPAMASFKKINALMFARPIELDNKSLATIRDQIDRMKFTAETFSGTIHCNTYKKNESGLECLLVSVQPEDIKGQKK